MVKPARRLVAAALMLLSASPPALAQNAPLVSVPPNLPLRVRSALEQRRAPIQGRIRAHNDKVREFLPECGPGTLRPDEKDRIAACAARHQMLTAADKALQAEKEAFAARVEAALKVPCVLIEGQLERDMDAMRRQQRTNEMGFREIEDWTKESQDAQKAAILAGVGAILGPAAEALERRENSARGFKGWLTRYDKQIRQKGVPVEVLEGRIQTAMRGYASAKLDAAAGRALSKGLELSDLWERFRTVTGAVANALAQSDADVRAALTHPAFQAFVDSDASASDVVRMFADQIAEAPGLKKWAPHYELASFVADYGYEAARWTAAYNRIVQQHKLADEQLKAVNALKLQIERTAKALQTCRASH